ncbi:MAG TPA: DNA polymerase IV, partial [Egibacteraceae bacterium]|nr:DNA polymerase IV [Egibacteraceae bacterium]
EPILHVDMDAFYAAVEVRREPSLAGRPVLVGGAGGRGVVASASYEARAFGVRSAMPMAQALRLCPGAVVVSPDFAAYQRVSAQLRAILLAATPLVEPIALDEAFLDVGGSVRLLGLPERIGGLLRRRIRGELGLAASVGVAPNKFLAKLCSGKAKPDGLLHLRSAQVAAFLAPLGVGDLWGVGTQTAARLERLGLRTVADVAAAPPATLARIVGPAVAAQLRRLARGEDSRPVVAWEPAKGMSAEVTFDRDVDDPQVLRVELLRLAEKVARRLRRRHLAGRTVTLKLRYADYTTVTRSRTLAVPTEQAGTLHREASALLEALRLERVRVRLVGLGVTNLVAADAARQLRLLDVDSRPSAPSGDDRWGRLERATDAARDRFGDAAVTRAALVDGPDPAAEGAADTAGQRRREPPTT